MSTVEVLVVVLLIAVVALLAWLLISQRSGLRAVRSEPIQQGGPGRQDASADPAGSTVSPESDSVSGQPLAELHAELDQLRADLAQAGTQLAQARADHTQARDEAGLARAEADRARVEADQLATLRAEHQRLLSQAQSDQTALDQARRQLNEAEQASAAVADLRHREQQLAHDQERIAASSQQSEQRRLRLDDEAKDLRQRTAQVVDREEHLARREARIDTVATRLDQREVELEQRSADLDQRSEELAGQAQAIHLEQQEIAQLTAEQAHGLVLQRAERAAEQQAAALIRQVEHDARRTADRQARDVITTAIVRLAADQTSDAVLTAVELPSDDMKGRIIGREGRNIRAFEQLTGVNVLIDDTPELVLLSSFDPVRREVARLTLSSLVADGRIHPARIEEAYDRALDLIDEHIMDAADEALDRVGITDLDPELKPILGSLRYRTSYGQNVLDHSIETGLLAGLMAAELHLDPTLATRAAFLHDIGKALTHEAEGSHAMVGADLLERHGEAADVVHAVRAHHNEVEPQTVEALLTQAADAVSGSRPGARRESLESYVKRLEQVERIAQSHEGVDRVFAMQAGREVRVMVLPDLVDDEHARVLARQIADELHSEVTFPGQIRVTVIRESRATATAV